MPCYESFACVLLQNGLRNKVHGFYQAAAEKLLVPSTLPGAEPSKDFAIRLAPVSSAGIPEDVA